MLSRPPDQNQVSHELPCARCGYILRGLPIGGVCPECAEPISTSMKGNLLRHAEPHWLRTVARGAAWTFLGYRAVLLGFVANVLLLLAVEVVHIRWGEDSRSASAVAAAASGVALVWLLTPIHIGIGLWFLMAPEPTLDDERDAENLLGRLCAAMVVPVFGIWILMSNARFSLGWPVPVQIALIHIAVAVIVMQDWTMRRRLADLQGRLEQQPRRGRIRQSGLRKWTLLLVPVIFLALYWIGPLRWPQGQPAGWSLPGIDAHRLLFLGMVIYWLAGVSIIVFFRKPIRHEVTQASPGR